MRIFIDMDGVITDWLKAASLTLNFNIKILAINKNVLI